MKRNRLFRFTHSQFVIPQHTTRRFAALCAPIILSAVFGAFTPGCGQESDETAAVRQARRDLEYLAANSGVAPEGKGLTYEKIIQNLGKAASSSNQGEADAARIIRAQANARSADLSAAAAARRERDSLSQVIRVRATLDRWRHLSDAAAALKSYDPASTLDDLAKQATAKDAEVAGATRELSLAEGALAELQAKAAQAQQQAQAERTREAEFRTQAIDKSQTERADLITKANQASRAGDAFEKTASDLLAQAASQKPAVEQVRLLLDSLRSQRTLIDASRTEIERLVRVNTEQSRKTIDGEKGSGDTSDRVGVKQLQETLLSEVASLDAVRSKAPEGSDQSLDQLYETAQRHFTTAAGDIRGVKGTGGKATTTSLTIAGCKHAEGDLLMAKATGLEVYASILESLAQATPSLPGDFAQQAKDAKAAFDAALTAARDAYSAARSDYESAGNREQMERVKTRLDTIGKSLASFDPRAPQTPVESPDQPAPTDPSTPTAGTGTDPVANPGTAPVATASQPVAPVATDGMAGEVIAVAQTIATATQKPDAQAFMAHIVFRNDKEKEQFTKTIPLFTKSIELDKACMEVFKKSTVDVLREEMVRTNATFSSLSDEDIALSYFTFADAADFQVTASPDSENEALFSSVAGKLKNPLRFRKMSDGWKWLFEIDERDVVAEDKITPYANALQSITDKLRGGAYGEQPSEFVNDLISELLKVVFQPPDK